MDQDILTILRQYQAALIFIGVDFSREDVQEALQETFDGFEDALMAVISYWRWNEEKLDYPSRVLVDALQKKWKPKKWDHGWMQDPRFIPPGQRWWKEAELRMGYELRNRLIVDVVDNSPSSSSLGYIVFRNKETLSLEVANRLGWERLIEYAKERAEEVLLDTRSSVYPEIW
ncbi:hypothetical protein [Coleofasciculus sp. FACHB-501]|uniref:hypothetical protein n=1 Tax=Cyanophyceae TaxID=3028117 RepID=UPI001688AF1E|nr:hypothetical protein [Coleofasciculus sp. FACHB-501]MBD1838867.1 hypothetical protein [Coleofasciculus sp. FACHB-501]